MQPRVDGLELVLTMPRHNRIRNVPVILVSHANSPNLPRLGNDTFLSKPFDLATLLHAIERFLASPHGKTLPRQSGCTLAST